MSIEQAAASIRAGIDQLNQGKATLLAAVSAFDEARAIVHQVTSGTSRPEPAQAIVALTGVLQQLGEVVAQHDAAIDLLTTYLTDIFAGSTTPAPQPPPHHQTALNYSRTSPQHLDRVQQVRRELPSRTATNRKTHGQWFIGDRPARSLVSGDDADASLAAGYLARIGQDRASVQYHVEVKLSALIRRRYEQTGQTANVTLVINNEMCVGRLACAVFLPRLLPPGCSITVITPKDRQTFTGEAT